MIQDASLGRIEVMTVPVPEDVVSFSGTYTYSGRVLVSGKRKGDPEDRDWYRAFTINDDGTDICEVFAGEIPQKRTANGVRWMCFPDNKRILLGDYIIEAKPDLDHCTHAQLIPLDYPEEITNQPGMFFHWSEIIISPDNEHMCWTTLLGTAGQCYVGRLVRSESAAGGTASEACDSTVTVCSETDGASDAAPEVRYHLEDICIGSNTINYKPDPEHEGCVIAEPMRGGEVKQFVRGGRAISEAGGGGSITDSVLQYLDSEEVVRITDSPNYEETTMFSPDETLGIVMSPRFSTKTSGAIFGQIPHTQSLSIQSLMNTIYMYCVAGVRAFRKGSIGPALIEIDRSVNEGRAYKGVDLSDPEGEWVYYSPMSWAPDSTKALWNEGTRLAAGPVRNRLRMVRLLDRRPTAPVPVAEGGTPSPDQIPYAAPVGTPVQPTEYPVRIAGRYSGLLENTFELKDGISTAASIYTNYSDDGKTFTDGYYRITTPLNMFVAGKTVYEGEMTVHGEHSGEMKLRAVFDRASASAPAMLLFEPDESGLPASRGYAVYDGENLDIADMEP